MPYKVIIDHPSIGDESSLIIHGLGTFKNHTETEISDADVERFRAMNSTVNVSNPHPETGHRKHMPVRGRHPVDLEIFGVRFEPVSDTKPEADEELNADASGGEE